MPHCLSCWVITGEAKRQTRICWGNSCHDVFVPQLPRVAKGDVHQQPLAIKPVFQAAVESAGHDFLPFHDVLVGELGQIQLCACLLPGFFQPSSDFSGIIGLAQKVQQAHAFVSPGTGLIQLHFFWEICGREQGHHEAATATAVGADVPLVKHAATQLKRHFRDAGMVSAEDAGGHTVAVGVIVE